MRLLYKRVVLKITGEVFDQEIPQYLGILVSEIISARPMVQLAIMPGGGNFSRGGKINKQERTMEKDVGDCYGMVGTTLNALLLHNGLQARNVPSRVLGAWPFGPIIPVYSASDVVSFLDHGQVVILAGGLGRGGISTDTAAVVRALEIRADAVLKGTKVHGIYTADPRLDKEAALIPRLTHREFGEKKPLQIFDHQAVKQAGERKLPIHVFRIFDQGVLCRVLTGQSVGSLIAVASRRSQVV